MTLRLVGQHKIEPCPFCKGTGKAKSSLNVATRSGVVGDNLRGGHILVPGGGKTIPCPHCQGKKVVAVAQDEPLDLEDSDLLVTFTDYSEIKGQVDLIGEFEVGTQELTGELAKFFGDDTVRVF